MPHPDRSDRLYGRDAELAKALESLRLASSERARLLLVAGESGIGKTALVQELRGPVRAAGGIYVEGKFDQIRGATPYYALTQAMRGLVAELLSRPREELGKIRGRIQAAFDGSGQVLLDLVPELGAVIWPQPKVEELPPEEARMRVHRLFGSFLGVFATAGKPLVLFLDDLQWVDSVTLELLQAVLSDPERKGLLVVGAFRDDLSRHARDLSTALGQLQSSAPVDLLSLELLSVETIVELFADDLRRTKPDVLELARIVHSSTRGNPFHVRQYLVGLRQYRLLTYSEKEKRWEWEAERIQALRDSADAEDDPALLARRLRELPSETLEVLRLAAYLGARFHLSDLMMVAGGVPAPSLMDLLRPTIDAGFLLVEEEGSDSAQLKFAHDGIQQAVYSLVPESERERTHLKIGKLLLAALESNSRPEALFDVVSNMNRSRRLLTTSAERLELARLNLAAGAKARASIAFGQYLEFMEIAHALLAAGSEDPDDPAFLSLADEAGLGLAEACYLKGQHEGVSPLVMRLLQETRSQLTRIRAHSVLVRAEMAIGRPREAARLALKFLAGAGIRISLEAKPSELAREYLKTWFFTTWMSERKLKALPELRDQELLHLLDLCIFASPALIYGAPAAFLMLSLKLLRLGLSRGYSPVSPVLFVAFAMALVTMGRYRHAAKILRIARHYRELGSSKLVMVYFSLGEGTSTKWLWEPFGEVAAYFTEIAPAVLQTGYSEGIGYVVLFTLQHSFYASTSLPALSAQAGRMLPHFEEIRESATFDSVRPLLQLIVNLSTDEVSGRRRDPARLEGEYLDPAVVLPRMDRDNSLLGRFYYCSHFAYLDLLLGSGETAVREALFAESLVPRLPLIHVHVMLYFCMPLALIRVHRATGKLWSRADRARVSRSSRILRKWAGLCQQNFRHKHQLIEAERESLRGRDARADALYRLASDAALAGGMIQDAALVSELHGDHFFRLGREAEAKELLERAIGLYREWGALAKVRQLQLRLQRSPVAPSAR